MNAVKAVKSDKADTAVASVGVAPNRTGGPCQRTATRLSACWLCLVCSACVNTSFPIGPDPAAQLSERSVRATASPAAPAPATYVLQAGDSFDVKFFYSPELNENVVVRPDGKISLQLIGELPAAGSSPGKLERELRTRYASVLRSPEVTVVVRQFSPQRVFVVGEVRTPGEMTLQQGMTVLQAIARAGFLTHDAEARNVVVLRYSGDNGPEFIIVNAKGLMDGEPDHGVDPLLQSTDVVFVPQTQIASIADFFGRYVKNIVPLWSNLGFSMVYYTNTARVVNSNANAP